MSAKAPTFRVKFTDPRGVWWTQQIANWAEAADVIHHLRHNGAIGEAFINTRQVQAEFERCFAAAHPQAIAAGLPHLGVLRVGCTCAKCRVWEYTIVRVPDAFICVGGFPLLDAKPADVPSDAPPCCGEEVGELVGPVEVTVSPAEPEACTACEGQERQERGDESEAPRPPRAPVSPLSLLDRLVQWLVGLAVPQGKESL